MNEDITFYILTPVYRVEKYIDECIKSVLSQTYQNFKLILVDDGSPDKSGTICDEFAARDNRIIVIHKMNQGLISARRTAIRSAKENYNISGNKSYFMFLDSDDYLKENALSVIVSTIEKEKCDVVVFGLDIVQDKKTIKQFYSDKSVVGNVIDKRKLYMTVFSNSTYNSLCRKAILCELIDDTDYSSFYHISHAEDLLQSIPVYKACKKATFIKDSLYNYRINPLSITHSVEYGNYIVDNTVRSIVLEFLQAENVFNKQDWAEYKQFCLSILKKEICKISTFNVKFRLKKQLFNSLKQDNYYKNLLQESAIDDCLLKMFVKNYYGFVVVLAKSRDVLTKVYHYITSKFNINSFRRSL